MNTPSGCCTGCSCAKNSSPSPTTNRCIGRSCTMANFRTSGPAPGCLTAMRSRAPASVGVARRSTGLVANVAGGICTSAIPQTGHDARLSERSIGCIGHQNCASTSSSAIISTRSGMCEGGHYRIRNIECRMPILRPLALAVLVFLQYPPPAVDVPKRAAPPWLAPYRDATGRLLGEALASDAAWQRLAYLGDTFGHRLSGSPNLEAAIRWAIEEMKRDGLENVHAEPVKVPYWIRGRESLEIAGAIPQPLVMLGLGNSVGTPPDGIEADLVVVHSFEQLE